MTFQPHMVLNVVPMWYAPGGRAGPRQLYRIPGVLAEMDGGLDSPRPSPSLMASVHRLPLRVVRLLNRPSGSCPSSYRPGLELAKRHSTTLHWSQLSEANRDSPRGARGTHLSLGGGVEEFVAAFHPPENVNGIILYI